MRKITNNKRGFTLTEIILVIAIIVILSAAVATGIAIDINRYNNYLENLKATGGTKWEANAREKTEDMFPKYVTPENTGEPTMDSEETDESEDSEETENTEDTGEPDTPTEPTKETNVTTPTEADPPETQATNPPAGGGSTSNSNYNQTISGSGKVTISTDTSKTIKSITIKYQNTGATSYSAFTVTYNGGGNGNFYNANNSAGIYGNAGQTQTAVITPDNKITGASGINISHSQGAAIVIESYVIEYE